jgi:leucyl-tRNA synthetase
MSYPFRSIEKKWQEYWEREKTFRTQPEDPSRPKYYVLDMFPYPSGQGLHVGHPEGYTATDIMARYKRHRGFNVLHPMGWDAFGLPAERYAMQTGIHPAETTKKNIDNFRRQLKSLGFSYDWDREINTTDEKYYRWTQWIFLKIFNSYFDEKKKKARPITELEIPAEVQNAGSAAVRDYVNSRRLAYIHEAPVNYCPELGTVLANEEVEEWTSKGYTVVRRPMKQWMLRITAYAERLLEDLELVDWPRGTLELQRNWIGRSAGATVLFPYEDAVRRKAAEAGRPEALEIFTTRPDTLFGVSYMVLAPEHPAVNILTTPDQKDAVKEYIEATTKKSELERTAMAATDEKTGVFTGGYVLHPFTGKKIPVWISDYVLMGYGTGAIMSVPAHDERDFAFAKKFHLPVLTVVVPADSDSRPEEASASKTGENSSDIQSAFTGDGIAVNSDFINGLPTIEAKAKIIEELEKRKLGSARVNYKLRDWLFSRQRYWGEPIPISFDEEGNYYPEDEDSLPLRLPPSDDFKPAESGESPLARIRNWVEYTDSHGRKLRRETNTMPQWAGSCWYYLRYIDPDNDARFVDEKKEAYWMGKNGVDLYVGGAEHAVLHLLYARFWHKVLYDLGYVSTPEPFHKLVHQGLILGEDGQKMSKSRGNVVNPDDVVSKYGADAFRLYEMFMGPLEVMKPWSSRAIEGVYRFLSRIYRFYFQHDREMNVILKDGLPVLNPVIFEEPDDPARRDRILHETIKNVTENIERMHFNKAISDMMAFLNEITTMQRIGRQAAETLVVLLSPFAPHLAEEIWQALGKKGSVSKAEWPAFDASKIVVSEVEIVFQVNGKIRARQKMPVDSGEKALEAAALANEQMKKILEGKTIRRVIVVKNKLVNVVAN